jgi:hypothetical protein
MDFIVNSFDALSYSAKTCQRPPTDKELSVIKNGTRFQSQVCDREVIVVKTAESLDDLRCGGAPMLPLDSCREIHGHIARADGADLERSHAACCERLTPNM